MHIRVDGNNFFHSGWIARLMELPREHPCGDALRSIDARAFEEGWDACDETPAEGRGWAISPAIEKGQIEPSWEDEDALIREGVIEAAHYARSLATIVHDETARKVLLDLADTLERGDYRRGV